MKNIILSFLFVLLTLTNLIAQYAEPAITGANFVPGSVDVGQTALLTVSFSNSGSSPIPAGSIELTISTANNYYSTDGTTIPAGGGGALFTWTYLGADTWRGSNTAAIPAFGGGNITLQVIGTALSPGFEVTNINVQPVSNFAAFNDSPNNNNLQPKLKVNATALDTDGDTIPDVTDTDDDGDGILDTVENAACSPSAASCDTDGDSIPNSLDLDSDNDGINDVAEAGLADADGNGIADGVVSPTTGAIPGAITALGSLGDKDSDGKKDPYDALNGTTPDGVGAGLPSSIFNPTTGQVICSTNCDPDHDGIVGVVDGAPTVYGDAKDTDGDGISDDLDLDDDGDGILDTVENAACSPSAASCDTDGDSIPNSLDLDSDNDGINDVAEAGLADADGNGIADGTINPTTGAISTAITALGSLGDKDSDGKKDPYDALNGTTPDGVGAGLPSSIFDPTTGQVICSTNCDPDKDGIIGVLDGAPTVYGDAKDTDGDGISDDLDDDGDGILDTVENAACSPAAATCDTDGDTIPNYLDLDSDNDGINDVVEAGLADADGNGIADGTINPTTGAIPTAITALGSLGDKDSDGKKDPYDALNGTTPDGVSAGLPSSIFDPTTGQVICSTNCDPDKDGIIGVLDGAPTVYGDAKDTDGDGISDDLDLDDDGDGILDTVENAACSPSAASCDTDGDSIPNSLDLDSDNDGINDVAEAGLADADGNGIADGVVSPTTGAIPGAITALGSLGDKDSDGKKDPYDALNGTTPDGVGAGLPSSIFDPTTGQVICSTNCDPDHDGIVGVLDGAPTVYGDAKDTDGDSISDDLDLDDDGDGILDTVENAACSPSAASCDTDGDSIPNSLDLDSDNDGINDVAEAGLADADGNGIADGTINPTTGAISTAITALGSLGDKDSDGKKDPYDALNGTTPDGVSAGLPPSIFDPTTGQVICSTNCDPDKDGIIGVLDGAPTVYGDAKDTDGDGISDDLDLDDDGDGILDTVENAACSPAAATCDTDGDTIPNYLDLDSDNDGINDVVEAGLADADGNGIADGVVSPTTGAIPGAITALGSLGDKDSDGKKDPYDALNGTTPDGVSAGLPSSIFNPTTGQVICSTNCDPDHDGIVGVVDGAPTVYGDAKDTDGDGISDDLDLDDDGDGILDTVENAACSPAAATCDTDGDTIPNYLDLDSDNDGINDVAEAGLADADGNGIADGTINPTTGAIPTAITALGSLGDKDSDGKKDPYDALNGTTPDGVSAGLPSSIFDPTTGQVICSTNCDPDHDGIIGVLDGAPTVYGDAKDTDGDTIPDVTDTDDDDDGILDTQDPKPLDTDNDGIPNATDTDDDGDGILDTAEAPGKVLDTDNDGTPNATDTDDDGDNIPDTQEIGVLDGTGKYTLPDSDGDGLPDLADASATVCVTLNLKVLLEGPYDSATGKMGTMLNQRGLLPGQTHVGPFGVDTPVGQPYTGAPWNYTGTEGKPSITYAATVVDWVLVSLRTDSLSVTSTVLRKAALLHDDGHITFTDACYSLPTGNYYLVIEHRNHMGVMSGKVKVQSNTLNFDFTQQDSYVINNPPSFGQIQVNGKWMMHAADGKKDTFTDNYDINFNDSQLWKGESGFFDKYLYGDFNMDADVNFLDSVIWKKNNGRYSVVPR
ncbi:hypothetical protein [Runella sp.]|uniref:hypothetical protein n=1 Tax=Runella sp. TaxID=1960881 RepID=UPI003D118035